MFINTGKIATIAHKIDIRISKNNTKCTCAYHVYNPII